MKRIALILGVLVVVGLGLFAEGDYSILKDPLRLQSHVPLREPPAGFENGHTNGTMQKLIRGESLTVYADGNYYEVGRAIGNWNAALRVRGNTQYDVFRFAKYGEWPDVVIAGHAYRDIQSFCHVQVRACVVNWQDPLTGLWWTVAGENMLLPAMLIYETEYFSNASSYNKAVAFTHELGHVLGLADHYYKPRTPACRPDIYSIMENWGCSGEFPTDHDVADFRSVYLLVFTDADPVSAGLFSSDSFRIDWREYDTPNEAAWIILSGATPESVNNVYTFFVPNTSYADLSAAVPPLGGATRCYMVVAVSPLFRGLEVFGNPSEIVCAKRGGGLRSSDISVLTWPCGSQVCYSIRNNSSRAVSLGLSNPDFDRGFGGVQNLLPGREAHGAFWDWEIGVDGQELTVWIRDADSRSTFLGAFSVPYDIPPITADNLFR